jgi:hypothetical protein
LEVKFGNGFQSRNEATIILFLEVFSMMKNSFQKNFKIDIFTGDYPVSDKKSLAFSKSIDHKNITLIPNFDFVFWKEAGISDYERQIEVILIKSKEEPIFNKLFWIGNINTHKSRELFFNQFGTHPMIECVHFSNGESTGKFVTLEDHCKYNYLIDIEGNGYSGRIKYLLFTGRVVLIQERKLKTYYHFLLKPFVHFVPVKDDFSDLLEKLDWLDQNPSISREIGINGQKFAMENLRKDAVLENYKKIILDFIK